MRCLIYSHDEIIGEADFVSFDPGMGHTLAPFRPNENYEKIRAVIREFSFLGTMADTNATEQTRLHADEVLDRLAALGLRARTAAGEELNSAGPVSILDFSEELDDDPYEVTLLGLPRDIAEKYFGE